MKKNIERLLGMGFEAVIFVFMLIKWHGHDFNNAITIGIILCFLVLCKIYHRMEKK